MKWKFKNILNCILGLLFVMCCASITFGQKPVECDVKGLEKPKFKVVSMYVGRTSGLRITMKPKDQTDENLIRFAKYIKQKFCQEKVIIALIFDNKTDARKFEIYEVPQIPDTLRATYSLDRDKGEEKLERIKMVDKKFVETPIKLTN
ncbi:MAG: hypothetical protein ACR2GD_10650 [Pyrinomonadaceae bacterium]